MELFGVRLVGATAETLHKLVLTLAFGGGILLLRAVLARLANLARGDRPSDRISFWIRQGLSAATAVLVILAILSIWFDDPSRLATGVGFFSAGLAFALQKVVTALAGYIVILRGKTFTVGDRIQMGGVRGDVISLGFIQTRIMEMGQPPAVQSAEPAMWVKSRQFTGRIVTVTNDKVFDEPVYNFTREFPFIWEEFMLPIAYRDDRATAERILLEAARRATEDIRRMGETDRRRLEHEYGITMDDLDPHVYFRLTDNWIEMTARFLVREHGVRGVKDRMAREILRGLDEAKIGIASGTYEIVGVPPVQVDLRAPVSQPGRA